MSLNSESSSIWMEDFIVADALVGCLFVVCRGRTISTLLGWALTYHMETCSYSGCAAAKSCTPGSSAQRQYPESIVLGQSSQSGHGEGSLHSRILQASRVPEHAVMANRTMVRQGLIEPVQVQRALNHRVG